MKPIETTSRNEGWPDSLIALLEKQQGVIGKLRELARYQSLLIESQRTEPLLGLLSQRQTLLDEFTSLQGELGSLTVDLEQRLETVADIQKHRIQSLIDEIGSQLDEIMRQDQMDQQLLETVRDRVKQELASTGVAQHARNAYTKSAMVETRFADREG